MRLLEPSLAGMESSNFLELLWNMVEMKENIIYAAVNGMDRGNIGSRRLKARREHWSTAAATLLDRYICAENNKKKCMRVKTTHMMRFGRQWDLEDDKLEWN